MSAQSLGARGARAGSIYQSILEAVVEQRLPPGSKLTEEQLGSLFSASRTTVRSALQALAHDHIVTLDPHRSAVVSAPTVESARDIFAGRKLVEVAIAREVAGAIDAAQIEALQVRLDEEHEALHRGDRATAIRCSGAFHVSVAATRGEGVLTAFLRGVIAQSSLVVALYGRRDAPACRHDEHLTLLAAFEAHDAEAAARLTGEHLDNLLADLDLTVRDERPIDLAAVLRAEAATRIGSAAE